LHDYRDGRRLDKITRPARRLTSVYNLLPEHCVHSTSVKSFQSSLQAMLRDAAADKVPDWQSLFSARHLLHNHPLTHV